jgi:TetR/AcrR family transcriptional regulator
MDGRKKRSEGTRKQILRGARSVFLEQGYAGASLKDIAERAEVTQSLIHHHFDNKDRLWEAVQGEGFQEVLTDMRPQLSRAAKSSQFLEALVVGYFEYLRDHPDYVRLLGWTYAEIRREIPTNPGQARQAIELLHGLQGEGKVQKDVDTEYLLPLVWSLVEGWFLGKRVYAHRLGLDVSAVDDTTYLEVIKRLLRTGVVA